MISQKLIMGRKGPPVLSVTNDKEVLENGER